MALEVGQAKDQVESFTAQNDSEPSNPLVEEAVGLTWESLPLNQETSSTSSSSTKLSAHAANYARAEAVKGDIMPHGSELRTGKKEGNDNFSHLKQWFLNRERARITQWLNSPANVSDVARMDQDIAVLKQYAPNSSELELLLQIRGLRGDQLAAQRI